MLRTVRGVGPVRHCRFEVVGHYAKALGTRMRVFRTTFAALLIASTACSIEGEPPIDELAEDSEGSDQAVEPYDTPALPASFDSDIDPDTIVGGQGSYDSERDLYLLNASGAPCTATLLRNNVVITAQHCIAVGGLEGNPPEQPNNIAVLQDDVGPAGFKDIAFGLEIAEAPNAADVALVLLDRNLEVDGRDRGESTEIWTRPNADLAGQFPFCQGYGYDACGGNSGFLKAGLTKVEGLPNPPFTDLISYSPFKYGQGIDDAWLQSTSDSGSSCRLPTFAAQNRQRITGVLTSGDACDGDATVYTEFDMGWRAYETPASTFRSWAQDQINEWTGETFDDTYDSGYLHAIVGPPGLDTTPWETMWFTYNLGGDFVLFQFYDDYEKNDATQEGTKWIYDAEVVENADISVAVFGHDANVTGLIARARDDEHYYRFSVDDGDGIAKIVMRDGNSFVTLAEETNVAYDPSTETTLRFEVDGNHLEGFVGTESVVEVNDPDYTYLAGRTGIYTYRMSSARFDDFSITRH